MAHSIHRLVWHKKNDITIKSELIRVNQNLSFISMMNLATLYLFSLRESKFKGIFLRVCMEQYT